MFVDLHVHSNYSDGIFGIDRIIDDVVARDLPGFAITDHDTFDGVKVAIEKLKEIDGKKDIFFIAGAEFSSYDPDAGEVHIIGYFSDYSYLKMTDFIREFQSQRIERARKILKCLKENGIDIDEEDVIENENKPVGRLNIARELVKKGYFADITDAFNKMLKAGAPCYVRKKEVAPETVIEAILHNGGKPVLAHPTFLVNSSNWKFVEKLVSLGLYGIEIYHPKISKELAEAIKAAFKGRLVFTGGSDFHGDDSNLYIGKYGLSLYDTLEIFNNFADIKKQSITGG